MIIINGKKYKGNSVVINGSKVIVDGVDMTKDEDSKIINVIIDKDFNGDLNLKSCDKIEIKGNVNGDIMATSGNIECDNVTGSIKMTSGNVKCNDIGGHVETTSGTIKANKIQGNAKTLTGNISKLFF